MERVLTVQSNLMCFDCGSIFTVHRKKRRQREAAHIKHLWCFKCQKETQHVEIGNTSLKNLAYKDANGLHLTKAEEAIMQQIPSELLFERYIEENEDLSRSR